MVAIPELETERLVLRAMELADAAAIQRLFPRWEIVRLLANVVPWPYPEDGAFTYIRDKTLPAMERGAEWHWTIRRKDEPGEVIGAIGLMAGEEDNRGFWIAPEWQRRGYATEAAERVTAFWFEELGMETMRIPKAVENVGSRRVSEKQGMRVVRTFEKDYVSGRLETEIWEITAEEWRSRQEQMRAKNTDI
jgi:RimJ/RimL family protein N-acetyltransferase